MPWLPQHGRAQCSVLGVDVQNMPTATKMKNGKIGILLKGFFVTCKFLAG
jgi:hypothetical protein